MAHSQGRGGFSSGFWGHRVSGRVAGGRAGIGGLWVCAPSHDLTQRRGESEKHPNEAAQTSWFGWTVNAYESHVKDTLHLPHDFHLQRPRGAVLPGRPRDTPVQAGPDSPHPGPHPGFLSRVHRVSTGPHVKSGMRTISQPDRRPVAEAPPAAPPGRPGNWASYLLPFGS